MSAYSSGYGVGSAYRRTPVGHSVRAFNLAQQAVFNPGAPAAVTRSTPVALLTNSGDFETAVSVGQTQSITVNKPANVAAGDLLIALVSSQTVYSTGMTATEGTSTWRTFGPAFVNDGTRRGATTWALEVTAANVGGLPSTWTWTNAGGAGTARWTATIFRVTGADLTNGVISAVGGESEYSGYSANTSPIPAFTVGANALVIAAGIAQNTTSQAPPVSWTLTGYTTHTGSYANTATGGVSWSAHYLATKTADASGTEPSVQQVMTPTPAGSQAWAVAVLGAVTAGLSGSGSGTLTYSGTATGSEPAGGAGTGTLTYAGTAAGKRTPQGAATGTLTYAGTAAGARTPKASGTGTLTLAGSAAGSRVSRGTATGTLAYAGAAVGGRVSLGSATGTLAYVGTATAIPPKLGSGSGTFSYTGSATGARVSRGAATGTFDYAGTATGARTSRGTSTGTLSYSGTAAGQRTPKASGTGSITYTGAAVGARASRGSATGTFSYSGVAVSSGVKTGAGTGTLTLTGAATGRRTAIGTSAGTLNLAGTATGTRPSSGASTGSFSVASSATGTRVSLGVGTGLLVYLGEAVGFAEKPPTIYHPEISVVSNQSGLYVAPTGSQLELSLNGSALALM